MQITSLSTGLAAAILANTVSGFQTWENKQATVQDRAMIVNNCPYPVYYWSVLNEPGCPSTASKRLDPGKSYAEQLREPVGPSTGRKGISIKISKTDQCKGVDITQLEYFIEKQQKGFNFNYLDVSYVDCNHSPDPDVSDCPARMDGYYLQAGVMDRSIEPNNNATWCPTFECFNQPECDKISYVQPHDEQTKTCDFDKPLDFLLCGRNPQGGSQGSAQPSSVEKTVQHDVEPQEAEPANKEGNAPPPPEPEITQAPKMEKPKDPLVKTEFVYVTKVEWVNAKRHAHANAHQRRAFRA